MTAPFIPRRKRKQLDTGRHVPMSLALERRIENGRRMGLDAKHRRGERQHARVNTPEFRAGHDGILKCCVPGCRLWSLDGVHPVCAGHGSE